MQLKSYFFLLIFFINLSVFSQSDSQKVEGLLKNLKLEQAQDFLLENMKTSETGKLYLGDIHSHLKEWDSAISYYKKLVSLKPNSALYHFKLGGAMGMKAMVISKFQAAFLISDIKRHLEKAVELAPDHIESRRALAQLYLELPSVLGGGLDKSMVHVRSLKDLSELDHAIAMASIYAFMDKEEMSRSLIRRAVEEANDKPSMVIRNYLYFELAQEAVRFQVVSSEVDGLMEKYLKGFNYFDLKTPAEAYLKLAQLSEKKGNKTEAEKFITKSLEFDAKADIALELQEDIKDM